MNKFLIALMAAMMLFVAGCASKPVIGTGTPIDIGDGAPLEEVAAVDDEAVEDLPDMVAAE
jgi:type IV pilus biogenesis protein CpaD/CtpE